MYVKHSLNLSNIYKFTYKIHRIFTIPVYLYYYFVSVFSTMFDTNCYLHYFAYIITLL